MNQLPKSASFAPSTLASRVRTGARAMLAAALGAAAIGTASDVVAAPLTGVVILDPAKLPDLTVSVAAPASVPAYDVSYLTFTINNAGGTGLYRAVPTNTVEASVDLTGLIPIYVEGPAGMTCNFGGHGDWNVVACTGTMAWGTSATVHVYFEPSPTFYCGRPTYSDVSVRYTDGAAERSPTNNRAIARTDLYGCIN